MNDSTAAQIQGYREELEQEHDDALRTLIITSEKLGLKYNFLFLNMEASQLVIKNNTNLGDTLSMLEVAKYNVCKNNLG